MKVMTAKPRSVKKLARTLKKTAQSSIRNVLRDVIAMTDLLETKRELACFSMNVNK